MKYVVTISLSVLTSLLMVLNTMILSEFPEGITTALIGYVILHAVAMGVTVHVIELLRLLHSLQNDLIQREKNTLISDLAILIARELRNPLTSVKISIELIRHEDSGEIRENYISQSLQKIQKAEETIQQYLYLVNDEVKQEGQIKFYIGERIRYVVKAMDSYALSQSPDLRHHSGFLSLSYLILKSLRDSFSI